MMMGMMMSISTAHNSIHLNALCAEGLFQKKSKYVEKVTAIRTKQRHTVYSEQVLQKTWVLKLFPNLKAQCAEGLFQKKSKSVEKVTAIRTKKRHTVYSEQVLQKTWVLKLFPNLKAQCAEGLFPKKSKHAEEKQQLRLGQRKDTLCTKSPSENMGCQTSAELGTLQRNLLP